MVDTVELKDDSLEKQGWQRRSILDEPRLGEVVEIYAELGLEVKVVALDRALADGCVDCIGDKDAALKVVYTRAREGA